MSVNTLVDAGVEIAEIPKTTELNMILLLTPRRKLLARQDLVKGQSLQRVSPIVLRDYSAEVVNKFIQNSQCLQEVAPGAGKTIIIATLSALMREVG